MSLLSISVSKDLLLSYFFKIEVLLIVGLLACLIFIWRNNHLGANKYLMYIISASFIFIAIYLGILGGILADELNLGGSIALELVVIILGIFTIFYTLWSSANEKK